MEAHIPPFTMPMFHDRVPRAIRPWLYVVLAFCFQFGGGVYLGAMNEMIGERSWMREDVTFMLYCTLAGMAIWFPVLFRMKFHFTNRFLLMTSATVLIVCNLLTMLPLPVPVMWMVCIIAGSAKIQGTFECMSNIQLWMTPRRDFAVFFPLLHLVLLTAMEGAGFLAASFAHHLHWTMMHWFVIGLMLLVLTVQLVLTRPFCPMPPERRVPLKGIDWPSAAGWVLFFLLCAYVLNYGDWLQWWHSPNIRMATATACLTLAALMVRMRQNPHAFIELKIVHYRHFPPIIFFVALFEVIMSVEHVLEMVYYEEVMHYSELTYETLNQWSLPGAWAGCLFALGWLKAMAWSHYRLIAIGMAFICAYCIGFYFLVSPATGYYQLVPPLICRGFGYAVLCIVLMWALHEVMSFEHFFQALCIFNFFHMFGGGSIGAAFLSHGIGYYVGDGFARYSGFIDPVAFSAAPFDMAVGMEGMVEGLLAQTVKILYGWMVYVCLVFIALFLLWDRPGVRRRVKRMPSWTTVGTWTLNSVRRMLRQRRKAHPVG